IQVVHRRPKFRAAPESVARMEALAAEGRIELVIPYQLAGLEGRDGQIAAVLVETLDGKRRRLEADVLLPFYGLAMNLGPIAQWGLQLDRNHIHVDPATCETSAPGICAISEIATYRNKLKLILTGFAVAATAALGIWCRPRNGGCSSTATISTSTRRPARPARPAYSPSATSRRTGTS